MSEFLNTVAKALREERWDDYEEAWLDAIESDSVPFTEFVKAAKKASAAGQGKRVSSVFALLAPQAENLPVERKRVYYETLVTCVPSDRDHRDTLLNIYREQYGGVPGFETYVKTADLKRTPDPASAILNFSNMVQYLPGSFVYHRSGWGVGEIKEILSLEGAAIIDFKEKKGHRVQVDAIPDICEQLPADHYLVLQWKDKDALNDLKDKRPTDLIKSILRMSKRPMPLARIREQLAGSVIPAGSWSKWWTKTRAALKKDPEVAVTSKKTPEYFLLDGPEGITASLDRRLQGQGLKEQMRIVREALDDAETDAEEDAVRPFFAKVKKAFELTDGPPELLLTALLFLKDNAIDIEDLPTVHEILGRTPHPGDVINLLPRQDDQRAVIDMLRTQDAGGWDEMHTDLLLRADDVARRYLVELMHDDSRDAEIDKLAKEVGRLPRKAPMFFLWLVRKVGNGNFQYIPSLSHYKGVDLYLKAVSLLNDFSVRLAHESSAELNLLVKRYKQHLGGRPFKLLINVVRDAEITAARNVYHQIEASPGFSGTGRQGLLAAILREQPTVLAKSEAEKRAESSFDDNVIYSTDVGIARKRAELEEIRNDKLPAIFKLIGEAAEFGDLSENAEFTSAIEERENLNRRALEIQTQLDKVRRIDPAEASTEYVTLGSRVALHNQDKDEHSVFSVLGPWDGEPGQGVISYLSPLGRALLDRRVDEQFTVELPGGEQSFKVESISIHSFPESAV